MRAEVDLDVHLAAAAQVERAGGAHEGAEQRERGSRARAGSARAELGADVLDEGHVGADGPRLARQAHEQAGERGRDRGGGRR